MSFLRWWGSSGATCSLYLPGRKCSERLPHLLGPRAMQGNQLGKELHRRVPELGLFVIIYLSLWDFVWRGRGS